MNRPDHVERVNIGPMARQINETGLDEFPDNQNWHPGMKAEKYALTAIFIDRIVTRANAGRVKRPPFGLRFEDKTLTPKRLDHAAPFNTVQMGMFETLEFTKDDELKDFVKNNLPENVLAVYHRLHSLGALVGDRSNMDGGLDFACVFMSAVCEAIPRFSPDVQDPDVLAERAKNSAPLVLKVAAANMANVQLCLNSLTATLSQSEPFSRFRPDSVEIGEIGGKEQLVISEKGMERLKWNGVEDLAVGRGVTIGCPALVNFGEGSAIQTLWDWHVDVARQIYPLIARTK